MLQSSYASIYTIIVSRVVTKDEVIKISVSRMYATRVGFYMEDKAGEN